VQERIDLREHKADETCPYCKVALGDGQEASECPACKTRHHVECWNENGQRCTVLGCTGRGAIGTASTFVIGASFVYLALAIAEPYLTSHEFRINLATVACGSIAVGAVSAWAKRLVLARRARARRAKEKG